MPQAHVDVEVLPPSFVKFLGSSQVKLADLGLYGFQFSDYGVTFAVIGHLDMGIVVARGQRPVIEFTGRSDLAKLKIAELASRYQGFLNDMGWDKKVQVDGEGLVFELRLV